MILLRSIALALAVSSFVESMQYMFQGFNGCTSNGALECALRVRKINRTTAALYGNITQLVVLDESYYTIIETFHSPLGNNQFSRYAMKIGPIPLCDFINNFWEDYRPHIAKYVDNVARAGECPIAKRVFNFHDMQLDAEMFPPYVPRGLWKLQWTVRNGEKYFTAEVLSRVYENGHF